MRTLKQRLEEAIAVANNGIAEFRERLKSEDPAYALLWSEDAFKAAAQKRVYGTLLAYVDRATVPQMVEEAQRAIRHATKYPPRSTSVQSNLMEQEIASAWVAALEMLEREVS